MPKFNVDDLVAALLGKSYEPDWKGPIEGYVVNFMIKNEWRVANTMDRSDIMQEAYCVFLRVSRKYKVSKPAHFMALFKSTWANHFTDLSIDDTKSRIIVTDVDEEAGTMTVGEVENDGYLATLIRQAPQEVLMVLNLMLRAPQELVTEVLSSWNGNTDARSKSNGSRRVNELLGLPLDQDSLGAVREYFSA